MICNICEEETRCYSLIEADMTGFRMRPCGMLFNICSKCLDKLVSGIKTKKTKLDDPDKPANMHELREKILATKHSIASRKGDELTTEEKV